jgi:TatD DNase family protein
MFVDSHCHLTFPELEDRIDEVRAEMAAASVDAALVICTTLEEAARVQALAAAHDNFWATIGVHPDNEGVREPNLQALVDGAAWPRVVAIGETGLDYYRLNGRSVEDMAWQRERFRVHIRAARQTGLPLVRGVFHCFTETDAVARAALDLGFDISFSGILSFRNAQDLRDIAAWVPLERCLIETDSPYLAPMPHRGKTNRPAWVAHVAACLAQAKGLPVDAVAQATTANFERLFGVRIGRPGGEGNA